MIAQGTDNPIFTTGMQQGTEPLRMILIANSSQGPTAKMFSAGVSDYNDTMTGSERLGTEIVTFDGFDEEILARIPDSARILVVVAQQELSRWGDSADGRIPCLSLEIAQSIIRHDQDRQVFLVPVARLSLTGVDVVAALLSGVSGIVDERGMVMRSVLHRIINHHPVDGRFRSMLLFGHSSGSLRVIKEMIEDWNLDIDSDDTRDWYCWRASLALAQLTRLEPLLGGSSQPYSYVQLAKALNLAKSKTSFRLTENDLRRVIGILARRWLGEDHANIERVRLPEYARKHGFPRQLPAILGVADSLIPRMLYVALRDLEIVDKNDMDFLPCSLARLPKRRHFDHLQT